MYRRSGASDSLRPIRQGAIAFSQHRSSVPRRPGVMRFSERQMQHSCHKHRSTSADIDPHQLSELLRDLYAATSDTTARATLADRLASGFDARSSMLQVRDLDSSQVSSVSATENVLAKWPLYVQRYYELDEWYIRARHHLGEAVLGEDLVAESVLMQTEWYNDYLLPAEIHHVVGASSRFPRAARL